MDTSEQPSGAPTPGVATVPGGRRPTLLQVAKRAGVSRATASLVIRDAAGPSAQSRERVLRAAAELGYRPDRNAQLLRQRQSRLLGVLFQAQDPFHADLIENIYAAAEEHGYDVVLSAVFPTRTEERAFEALATSRCQAVVALGADQACNTDFGSHLPIVEIGRPTEETSFDAVFTDDEYGVGLAVEHLVALGHRDITHIDGGDAPGAAERRTGYVNAMKSRGLQDNIRIVPGDYTELSGAAAAQQLLSEETLPTAVIAGNDQCAAGLIDELRRAGVVIPGQVSIVGYDDSRLARLAHINLTTVRQDAEQLARIAVDTAIGHVDTSEGLQPPKTFKLMPQLVIRASTGPARLVDLAE